MSRRSVFKINQRAREGVEGQRRVRAHVLATQTAKVAELVAKQLQGLVVEEVSRELEKRGFHDRFIEDLYAEHRDGDREDSTPAYEVRESTDAYAGGEVAEPAQEA